MIHTVKGFGTVNKAEIDVTAGFLLVPFFMLRKHLCVPDLLSIFITLLNFVKCLFLHLLDSNVFVWFCSFFYWDGGEGNGNPLQCSCLENPVARGAWRAAIYGISQSQTRLKWLSMHACIEEWQPTPIFLPGESQGQRSLVGCHLWGRRESDTDWSDLAAAATEMVYYIN